ncbi:ATP-dependent 6-phosphofructokinase [bacterium]|nr:ATP-dependent 6-phosphofructokinase [bacterium]
MDYKDVIANPDKYDFTIETLGSPAIDSPFQGRRFIEEYERVSFAVKLHELEPLFNSGRSLPAFERSGPRSKIFHDPAWSRAAIVTCGGLCPGLNDVIKNIVNVLWFGYGIHNIYGIRYGYRGLSPKCNLSPVVLNPDVVDTIHEDGGTILGSSRGNQDIGDMVDTLMRMNINMLFTIGGDGTLQGASAIADEIARRKRNISVIGIPKTIDNDLGFMEKTFGFDTAVLTSADIITSAHNEAKGAYNGIGLVKLMGRDSGFIASYASIANSVVNFCLIPEVPLILDGEHGLLRALERRFDQGKDHAVIVVAEGAGQDLFRHKRKKRDKSGNLIKNDIGLLLKSEIQDYFEDRGREVNIKYMDPSYFIRSVNAKGTDSIFCNLLGEHAVHAAMAGKTNMVVGYWSNTYTHVPIHLATLERRKVNLNGDLWNAVLGLTQQNVYFHNTVGGSNENTAP